MALEPRHRLAGLLTDNRGSGTFSARRTAPPADLQIEVTGIGPIELPVTSVQARQLIAIARPARYGHGEQTLTDVRVRDTWELPKSRIKIDKRRWSHTLRPVLDGLRSDLGLPDGSRLTTELHSVLIYTPGQFFVPHQDTEKTDDMIGTLTVTLPGSSKGGELVIDHGGEQVTYRSSATALSFVAFYADCRHEVRPVTSGYRLVLTYNLLLVGNTTTVGDVGDVGDLTDCLARHFAENDRLVYLLDHEYTQRGLTWQRLKGVDAQRVFALRSAGVAAGCEIALALADVHETWNAVEPYEDWYDDYHDHGDGRRPSDQAEYQLQGLLEKEIGLDSWVDSDGAAMKAVATSVADDEVCASTSNDALTPYESEYEGYMGNYGNTVDRWYHRGAVVLWPRDRDFMVRAEGDPAWALESLARLVRDGEPAQARELAASLGSVWADWRISSSLSGEPTFRLALDVALGVADADVAAMLLRPFRLERVTPAGAPALVDLVDRYGESWLLGVLRQWDPQQHGWYRGGDDRAAWVAALPGLVRPLVAAGGGRPASILLAESWGWLGQQIGRVRRLESPSHRVHGLAELATPTAGLLVAAAAADPDVISAVTRTLDQDDLTSVLMQVLRAVMDADPGAGQRFSDLFALAVRRLRTRLAMPTRGPDDWSIQPRGACRSGCRECDNLDAFLLDPARRTVAWPLSEYYRRHIEDRIRRHELPVDHRTIKSGRPYTIELTKSAQLFAREAQQRSDDQESLVWLESAISR